MGSEQQGPTEIIPHGNVDEVHVENKEVLVGGEAAAAVVIVPVAATEQPPEEKAATQETTLEQNASLGPERKVSTEDPTAIIESLRARLLAERNSSKAAKQQSQQLAKKVKELERSLRAEIQRRKRCDEIIEELLAKLQEAGVKVDPKTAEKSEEQEPTRQLRPNWISNNISRRHSLDGNEGDLLHAHLGGDQDSTSPQSPSGSSDTGLAATRRTGRSCRTIRRKETSELGIDEQVKGTWTKVGADVLELAKLRNGEESGWLSRMVETFESKNEGSCSTEHEDKGETEGAPASNLDETEGSVDTETSTSNNQEGLEENSNAVESQAGHDSDQSGASSQHENDSNSASTQAEQVKRVPGSPVTIQMEAIKAKEGRSNEAPCISSGESAATERGIETSSSTVQGNNCCEASGIRREETRIHTSGNGEIRNPEGDNRVQNPGEISRLQMEDMARKASCLGNGYNPIAPERDSWVPEGLAGYQKMYAGISGQQQQLRNIEPANMTGYESPARNGQNNFMGGYHHEQTNTRAYTAGRGYQNIDPRYVEGAWTEQNQPIKQSPPPPTASSDNVEDILRALRIAKQQLKDAADTKQMQGNHNYPYSQGYDIGRAPARGGGDWQQRYDNTGFATGSLVSKASFFSERPLAVPWNEPAANLPQMPNPHSAPAGYVDRLSIAKDLRYLSPHQF